MAHLSYRTAWLSALLVTGTFWSAACFVRAEDAPEIVSVRKIWDRAKWNGTTDLIRFKNRWWCSLREAEGHGGGLGKARIIVSEDGEHWESAALLGEPRRDLRDPHLTIMPDGRLMCIMAASVWSHDEKNSWDGRTQALTRSPRVSFSSDGREWTQPKKVLAEDHWLWRVTWHKGVGYSMSKLGEGRDPRRLMLYTTTDGLDWQWVCEPRLPNNTWNGSETTLRFLPDDTAVALTRPHWVGTSQPPYRQWKWTRFASYQPDSRHGDIGGPNFIPPPGWLPVGFGSTVRAEKKNRSGAHDADQLRTRARPAQRRRQQLSRHGVARRSLVDQLLLGSRGEGRYLPGQSSRAARREVTPLAGSLEPV